MSIRFPGRREPFISHRNGDYALVAVPPFPVEQSYPETIGERRMETYIDWIAPTFIWSLTGLPVASVPCGLDARRLPVGIQVVAPPFGEEAILALAREIQRARPLGAPPLAC